MNRPEVISFDAAGTLIEPYPSVGVVYGRVLQNHGISADAAALDRAFAHAYRHALKKSARALPPYSSAFWKWIVDTVSGKYVCDTNLLEPIFHETYERFAHADCWEVKAGIQPCLEALSSSGYRLVVFSNNDSRLHAILSEIGLAPFFEAVFVSTEIGFAKPDPRAFVKVADALKTAPGRILHCGDSLESDGRAALRAGWQARLVHPTRDPEGYIPTIEDWSDLPKDLA